MVTFSGICVMLKRVKEIFHQRLVNLTNDGFQLGESSPSGSR